MWCCVCRDGRLQERDQILVINGSPLEPGISQQQALSLLQQPGETVELVVARGRQPDALLPPTTPINTVRKLWHLFKELKETGLLTFSVWGSGDVTEVVFMFWLIVSSTDRSTNADIVVSRTLIYLWTRSVEMTSVELS